MVVCALLKIICLAFFVQCSFSLRISPVMTMDRKRIDFFATTAFGLERTLANEVRTLSGVNNLLEGKGSVSFQGTIDTGLEALLWLRTPLKLMERISTNNNIKSKSALYDWIASHNWQSMIDPNQTLKCDTILGQDICAELNHSHFTALTIKNAIVDQMRSSNTAGIRPSVDTEDPDMPLSLYLHRARGTLYRVWSGEKSMHKRGYRSEVVHKAALRETTAAALLLNTEWTSLCEGNREGHSPPVFCDPMCGSGTFVVEAALLAADTAPGLIRYVSPVENNKGGGPSLRSDDSDRARLRPNPLRWPDLADVSAPIWQALWNAATLRDRRATMKASGVPAFVLGNDIHGGAIHLARQAATKAGVQHLTHFSVADVAQYKLPAHPVSLFVTNPPWGNRMDGAEDAAAKLDGFAHRMRGKGSSSGTPMWVLSGGGEEDSRDRGRGRREEQTMVPYLPGRPAATMRLRVASTDMMFEEHLL